jgi:hypothetical protein
MPLFTGRVGARRPMPYVRCFHTYAIGAARHKHRTCEMLAAARRMARRCALAKDGGGQSVVQRAEAADTSAEESFDPG